MESEKISETPKEGSLDSKRVEAQNPYNKSLEVSTGPVVCENEGSVNVDSSNKIDVSNLEVGKELGGENTKGFCSEGFENVKEPLVGGNVAKNEINKRSLECCAEEGNVVITESNEVNKGDLSILEGDTTVNANLLVLQKNMAVNEEIGVGKVMSEVKGKDAPKYSPEKKEGSGDGINLFVEVFGPLNGIKQSDDANCHIEHDKERRSPEQENAREGNGMLLSDNGDKTSANGSGDLDSIEMMGNSPAVGEAIRGTEVESEVVSNLRCLWNIGDLVWVKTKTQLWWPGIICDPSNATKDTAKSDKRDCVLVKYFGNVNLVWCSPSQLKPFLENLEHMSNQNSSRSFLGAIEKAIGEIGRRVRIEMTCSCFSKESQMVAAQSKKVDAAPKDKMGVISAFSAAQLEPATFLAAIRYLARCISMPCKLDFAIMQNCLSAFYHSIGHLQLPMHQLRPATEDKDRAQDRLGSERKDADLIKLSGGDSTDSQKFDHASTEGRDFSGAVTLESTKKWENLNDEIPMAESGGVSTGRKSESGGVSTGMKSESGYGSRERRKSKYLSYPYVNDGGGHKKAPGLSEHETEDPKDGSSLGVKTENTSSQCVISTPMTKCRGKTKKKGSRKPTFGGSTHCGVEILNVSSAKMLLDLHLTALNCLYPMKSQCSDSYMEFFSSFRKFAFLNQEVDKQQESNHEIINQDLPEASSFEHRRTKLGPTAERVNFSGNDVGSEGGNPQEISHHSSTVNPKRRARKKKEVVNPSGPAPSPAATGLSALRNDSQEMIYDAAKTPKVPKKRKKKAEATLGAGLPDLNGNNTNLSIEDMHVTGPAVSLGKLEPKRRKRKDMLASGCLQTDNGVGMPDVNGNGIRVIPLLNNMQASITGQNNSGSTDETAAICLNSESIARQSDANGHIVESSSSVRSIQHTGILSPVAKPERKKRKRKEKTLNFPNTNITSAIPDLNGNVAESITLGKDLPGISSVSPGGKPRQKRRRRNKTAAGIPDINANYSSKMENHIEALGAVLLLNFAPGSPLPSKESLVSIFSVFGALKESETQVLNDSSAQIVFVRSSDAGVACRSLEKTNPFGPALASFRLNYLGSASRISEQINNLRMPQSFRSIDGQMAPANLSPLNPHNGDAPDLQFIKRNLDMMKLTLEKAGDNLSPETKAKLENEIKGFMAKVISLVGSSSS